jgi:hypothetical protein
VSRNTASSIELFPLYIILPSRSTGHHGKRNSGQVLAWEILRCGILDNPRLSQDRERQLRPGTLGEVPTREMLGHPKLPGQGGTGIVDNPRLSQDREGQLQDLELWAKSQQGKCWTVRDRNSGQSRVTPTNIRNDSQEGIVGQSVAVLDVCGSLGRGNFAWQVHPWKGLEVVLWEGSTS